MKQGNSRAKGARIEREAAKYLTSIGFPTQRAARCGVRTGEDLVHSPGVLANVHIEVKGDQSLWPWTVLMVQALHQASDGARRLGKREYAVLWKHNKSPWGLTFDHDGPSPLLVTVYGVAWIANALKTLNAEPVTHLPGATACGCGRCGDTTGGTP